MSLLIDFSPTDEARLSAAAQMIGLAPVELIKRLTLEHLPLTPLNAEDDLDAKLRRWQEQDGTPLMPDVPTHVLFAQWAEEDAHMTHEEREAEDRLWEDIEQGLAENSRVLQLRCLG